MSAIVIGIIVVVGGIVLMIVLLSLIKKDSPFADLGINLKRVYCPKCNFKQPIMRVPANERQVMSGGYTCKSCGTEMDKYGTEV